MYPVTHHPQKVSLSHKASILLRHNTTGQEHDYLFRVELPFLLWVAKSVCVMACPCGSVPVGVETLHERLSCSRPGKKVASLSKTLTCQIGTHQCTRRPMEEWYVRHEDKVYWQAGSGEPAWGLCSLPGRLPPPSNQALRTAVVTLTTADLIERGGQSDR